MTQFRRRAIYTLAGAVPALVAFLDRPSFTSPFNLGVFIGFLGLCCATVVTFPAARLRYWVTAALLAPGLCIALPFLVLFLVGVFTAGVDSKSLPSSLMALWALLGPMGVALHFLLRARHAPNNSFKPKPLRGSA